MPERMYSSDEHFSCEPLLKSLIYNRSLPPEILLVTIAPIAPLTISTGRKIAMRKMSIFLDR
jgi:hypothetical protein